MDSQQDRDSSDGPEKKKVNENTSDGNISVSEGSAKKVQPGESLHLELIEKIIDGLKKVLLDPDSFAKTKSGFKGLLDRGVFDGINTPEGLMASLESEKAIGISNYDVLSVCFLLKGHIALVSMIDVYSKEIYSEINPELEGDPPPVIGPIYDTSHVKGKRRGLLVIFNQFTDNNEGHDRIVSLEGTDEPRFGTMKDEENLAKLFTDEFNFEVLCYRNQSKEAIIDRITEIQRNLNLTDEEKSAAKEDNPKLSPEENEQIANIRKTNCTQLFFAMMSHGSEVGVTTFPVDTKHSLSSQLEEIKARRTEQREELIKLLEPEDKDLKRIPKLFKKLGESEDTTNWRTRVSNEKSQLLVKMLKGWEDLFLSLEKHPTETDALRANLEEGLKEADIDANDETINKILSKLNTLRANLEEGLKEADINANDEMINKILSKLNSHPPHPVDNKFNNLIDIIKQCETKDSITHGVMEMFRQLGEVLGKRIQKDLNEHYAMIDRPEASKNALNELKMRKRAAEVLIRLLDKHVDIIQPAAIAELFSTPKLAGIPKVLMIQACRGHREQPHLPQQIHDDDAIGNDSDPFNGNCDEEETMLIPVDADILITYPQTHGYKAKRKLDGGSYFIDNICEIFKINYRRHHVMDMMTMVADKCASRPVSGTAIGAKQKEGDACQMPCLRSTLRKKLYIRP